MKTTQAEFDAYTVFHTPASTYRSLLFAPRGPGQDIVVPQPLSVISRKDGDFTVKARDPQNTVTISPNGGVLFGVHYDGTVVNLSLLG